MSVRILTSKLEEFAATAAAPSTVAANPLSVHPLTERDEAEVLAFLAERSLHTVVMAGHIRDNGIESYLNRGRFHACRNGEGRLEGVALIGHATLVETRSEAALAAFARLAQSCPDAHMIMGEQEKIERFWMYYARVGQLPRRICRELLLEQRWPVEAREPVSDLRLATLDDLEEVMQVQGEMACAESGINPSESDPVGFRLRCARRIEQKRVWVWAEKGRLIFKADIISDTPQVTYLEGIYINPQERGKSYGARCMSQLGRELLARTGSLCILVSEQSQQARAFFEHIGFRLRSCYDTVFLEQRSERKRIRRDDFSGRAKRLNR
jgi:predicted GNAT family acetyltransferase